MSRAKYDKPCKECGGSSHYAKGLCQKCYRKLWCENHKEHRARYWRRYYALHHGKLNHDYLIGKNCPDCEKRITDRSDYCANCAKKGSRNPAFGRRYDKHPRWKGGSYSTAHNDARRLYWKDHCEICGTKAIEIHCINKIYSDLSKGNWKSLCVGCHKGVHREQS